MSRARELAKLANPEVFSVDSVNNVGLNSLTPDAKLDVIGVVSATSFSGDGSQLTGIIAGATLSASNGTQRLVVTSQTTGSMTQAATNSDITYDTGTNTISATQFSGSLLGNATGLQGTPSITVQDITAETVSIGGTLSYEDVSNINSVGIITANKGIKVPNYGMTVTGVVTATSYQGDGSGLSGVESGVSNFVASGTIPNGATVVIKTDGTVGVVTSTGSPTPTVGTLVTFDSDDITYMSSTYDANSGKVVIAYRDGNTNGTAIVGTVSGSSISFGSAVVFNNGSTSYTSCAYDSSNNKVIISYKDAISTDYGTSIVGTISGTNISFGSPSTFNSSPTNTISSVYDPDTGKVVIAFKDISNSNKGKLVIGTVSGTGISFGTLVQFNAGSTSYISCAYDTTNNKVIIAYTDGGNSSYGTARVGTVSGTSISVGSPIVFNTGQATYNSCAYDSTNNRVVIAYQDGSNSDYGTAVVGTVSGTSISFGSEVVFSGASTNYNSCVYDSTSQKVVISYSNTTSGGHAYSIVGTVSGTSISFGTATLVNSANSIWLNSTFDSTNGKVVINFNNQSALDGDAVVFGSDSLVTNLTSENYIGLAAESISNGATGKITTTGGINSGQTGLTTAQTYYVQNTGGIGTITSSPSVVAGTSVSDTKVLVWKS